jgi:FlaA1/EpsC-like NDP-sugar epimerase
MPDPLPDEHVHRGLLPTFGETFETHRLVFQLTIDIACWAVGLVAGIVLRYEFTLDPNDWGPFSAGTVLAAIAVAGLLQAVSGLASGLYVGRYRFGSFDEVLHLVRSVMVTLAGLALANQFLPRHLVPLSVTVVGALIALTLMSAVRYLWRLALERSLRPSGDTSSRTLVYGAGEAGLQIITAMLRSPTSPYLPVALFDDDPGKRNLRLLGVPVVGGRDALAREARRLDASVLVFTMPTARPDTLRELASIAMDAGLQTLALPPITELFGSAVGVSDIRPITEADLLGRHEIDTDIDAIAGYLTKRRVLVTGAGGSIGSELCRQISRFGPAELVMLDRDESALHGVQLLLEGRALLESRNLVVGDIRDRERVYEIFAEHRPEVVFHAAALKHLPLLELHPGEALKTNVYGTVHVLDAARAHGVQRFVNISTDKAADPSSVLGFTKRIAEKLTTSTAEHADGTYLSVRFGNVLGSRGSVLTSFRSQVSSGGPITVTHPDATRYFMTVEEAVQLVVQAGAVGRDGEALVLDMGRPVRIDDVARRLASQHDRPIEVVYTGLRPGEKLHEVLLGRGELDRRPAHPLISHVSVPALSGETVRRVVAGHDEQALREALGRIALAGFEGIDPEGRENDAHDSGVLDTGVHDPDHERPPAGHRAGKPGRRPFGAPDH